MKKIIVLLLLSLCIVGSINAQNLKTIDDELQQLIAQKNNELISINIILKSQIDVDRLNSRRTAFDDEDAKREAVLKEFKN